MTRSLSARSSFCRMRWLVVGQCLSECWIMGDWGNNFRWFMEWTSKILVSIPDYYWLVFMLNSVGYLWLYYNFHAIISELAEKNESIRRRNIVCSIKWRGRLTLEYGTQMTRSSDPPEPVSRVYELNGNSCILYVCVCVYKDDPKSVNIFFSIFTMFHSSLMNGAQLILV